MRGRRGRRKPVGGPNSLAFPVVAQKAGEASSAVDNAGVLLERVKKNMAVPVAAQMVGEASPAVVNAARSQAEPEDGISSIPSR